MDALEFWTYLLQWVSFERLTTRSISSMLCGRPTSIHYGVFSDYQDLLPQPIDDAYISRGQNQPAEIPSLNAFFRHTVRLYHIMDDVLLRLCKAKGTSYLDMRNASIDIRINRPISDINAVIPLLNSILQFDGHLLSWHESLPSHLKFSYSLAGQLTSHTVPWNQRQVHSLRSHFLSMRMLLHRQTLLFLLQPQDRREWPQNGVQEYPPFSPIVIVTVL